MKNLTTEKIEGEKKKKNFATEKTEKIEEKRLKKRRKEKTLTTENEAMEGESLARSEAESP